MHHCLLLINNTKLIIISHLTTSHVLSHLCQSHQSDFFVYIIIIHHHAPQLFDILTKHADLDLVEVLSTSGAFTYRA